MAAPYILAGSFSEAHRFAREDLGLKGGHYRVVNSAGTLKAVRNVDLYLVPGWQKRFDRFKIQTALRWTRMNVIDLAEAPLEDKRYPNNERTQTIALRYNALRDSDVEEVPDDLDPPGVQLVAPWFRETPESIAALEEERAKLEELEAAQERGEPVPSDPEGIPVVPEEEPKRRRRRCSQCGVLVEPDEVEAHKTEHDAEAS